MTLQELLDQMDAAFDEQDFIEIVSFMSVDYDNLEGASKRARMREMIEQCLRVGRIEELVAHCASARAHLAWSAPPYPKGLRPAHAPTPPAADTPTPREPAVPDSQSTASGSAVTAQTLNLVGHWMVQGYYDLRAVISLFPTGTCQGMIQTAPMMSQPFEGQWQYDRAQGQLIVSGFLMNWGNFTNVYHFQGTDQIGIMMKGDNGEMFRFVRTG